MQINSQSSDEEQKNPKNRAQKQKELKQAQMKKQIYTNSEQLYQALLKYPNTFKAVKRVHPILANTNLIDFSLNAKGPSQDLIYAKCQFYRNNIRRGNTLIQQKKNIFWGRKGLTKFFDITKESINAILNQKVHSLSHKQRNNHKAIFSEIENILSCNVDLQSVEKCRMHIYRLNKANGQNAQISYSIQLQQWIICSKNVSIAVKNASDLKNYNQQRYNFAKLIAQTWFNIISQKNEHEIQILKKQLSDKTIVGEYCGNPQYQHLVKYSKITIYFYAAVKNNDCQTCLPPFQTFQLLEKNCLPIINNYTKCHYNYYCSFEEMGQGLNKLFHEISVASIFVEQEGSVLYFVAQIPNKYYQSIKDNGLEKVVKVPQEYEHKEVFWKVISLGKLKTLEYRLLRKLRQKLKSIINKPKVQQKKLEEKYGSFQKESKQLFRGGEKLSKPLKYYFCIAMICFNYVSTNIGIPNAMDLISQRYLDFISTVFWCVQNKKNVTVELMKDEKLQKELRQVNWQEYSTDIVNQYELMLQQWFPMFNKIKKSSA